ncbi:dihydroxyacetone kinase family protein [Specibacter cremeus]|uniref:dihydroxyacetone kinase family protein n=1 Tax=Specibacter cremeus TaxID=1629051 RepID=UPI000F7B45A9|nr:dihydroxyacetone kinase family protein [Specibacter cremeus]
MTKIFNDPAEFADEQFAGFLSLYADRLRGVPGGAVALPDASGPQVAVVIGGGSGHYPAFCGLVGPGLASGAVVGNIFTSPSAAQVYSVAKAADQGRGVILSFGNYAGDTMNFGIAAERLRKEGIDTRIVVVTDDIASAPEEDKRRGIAGDFTVFKAMGAAAAAGLDLDGVERIGRAANAATRTLGVAFSGCTMPGAQGPLFTVPEGHLGLGLGIHGEPGIRDEALPSAQELGATLVRSLLKEAPERAGKRVGVILNGLGTTKYEELFLLWNTVASELASAGLEPVDVEVGELVTSLDMGGCSLTLMWLDEELETYWTADAYTPAYRKQKAATAGLLSPAEAADQDTAETETAPPATAAARALGRLVLDGLATMRRTLHEHEKSLGDIDAVAGDGDHGRGMVRGIDAALTAALAAAEAGDASETRAPGGAWLLHRAGGAWAEQAGGTSGVLWGAALEGAAASLTDDRDRYTAADFTAAADAFAGAITDLGRAKPGDKTLVDALVPFVDELRAAVGRGTPFARAWSGAARAAVEAATATAGLRPKLGRARPLAEKSVGTPDAGATSLALIVTGLCSLNNESHHELQHEGA